MKVGRFTAGFLSALIAAPIAVLTGMVEWRVAKRLHWQLIVGVFLGTTGGVLWLGEEYGVIAKAYRDSRSGPLSLK
jgi:hypothetical protein